MRGEAKKGPTPKRKEAIKKRKPVNGFLSKTKRLLYLHVDTCIHPTVLEQQDEFSIFFLVQYFSIVSPK